jgi:glycosyltransferase involved in cell wall biosynthesis
MWLKKTVAAIIPASRNKNSIFTVIQELDATGYIDEVLVVDNGVDVETHKQIKKTRARFVKQKKYDVGRAIKTGIKSTKADLIVITEPDGSFKGEDVFKLLSYSSDFDTVFGSRTHVPLIGKSSGMTFLRRLVDDLFGKMISILFLSSNLTDVGCTFRLTNRKGYKSVIGECKSSSEIFLAQWLVAAAKNKVRFIEIPVNFTASKETGTKDSFPYLAIRGLCIFSLILKVWFSHTTSKPD